MTSTTSDTSRTAIGGGEITCIADLRAEAERAEEVLDEVKVLFAQLGQWANELPDRYIEAKFGTDALSAAINRVTDWGGDGDALAEVLPEILAALDEADALGEKVTEIAADGKVEGFTAR